MQLLQLKSVITKEISLQLESKDMKHTFYTQFDFLKHLCLSTTSIIHHLSENIDVLRSLAFQ